MSAPIRFGAREPNRANSSSITTGANAAVTRPTFVRRETEQILDYYQSSDAGRPYQSTKQSSWMDTDTEGPVAEYPAMVDLRRKPSIGGSDNRRLHIVELDASTPSSSASSQASTPSDYASPHSFMTLETTESEAPQEFVPLRRKLQKKQAQTSAQNSANLLANRRGHDQSRLALVAPPDASPMSYTNLSPPISQSANAVTGPIWGSVGDDLDNVQHRRTKSNTADLQSHRTDRTGTSPVGFSSSPWDKVNLTASSVTASLPDPTGAQAHTQHSPRVGEVQFVDQYRQVLPQPTVHSRSNSPEKVFDMRPTLNMNTSSTSLYSNDAIVTPAIGQEKDPMTKVAAPIVVGLEVNDMGYAVGTNGGNDDMRDATLKARKQQMKPLRNSLNTQHMPVDDSSSTYSSPKSPLSQPPPRPPRLHSPRRQNSDSPKYQPFQTVPAVKSIAMEMARADSDYSLVAVSVTSSDDVTNTSASNEHSSSAPMPSPDADLVSHRREGAFPSSSIILPPRHGDDRKPQTLLLDPTPRPQLGSRWSSYGTVPSAGSPGNESIEQLDSVIESATDETGLVQPSDVTPSAIVEPPQAARSSLYRISNIHINRSAAGSPSSPFTGESSAPSPVAPGTGGLDVTNVDKPKTRPTSTPATGLRGSLDYIQAAVEQMADKKSTKSSTPSPRPASTSSLKLARHSSLKEQTTPERRLSNDNMRYSPSRFSLRGSPSSQRSASLRNITPPSISNPLPLQSSDPKRANLLGGSSMKSMSRLSLLQPRNMNSGPSYPSSMPWLENTPPASTKQRKHKQKGSIHRLPDAMVYGEVLRRKTPLERASGYAQKMQELAEEDTGLGDWVDYVKFKGIPRRGENVSPLMPNQATRFTPKPRNISHGSEMTDVTFPMRADGYVATNLAYSKPDSPPRGPPVNLPYPGLVQGMSMRQSTSTRNFALGSSNSMRSVAPSNSQTSNGPVSSTSSSSGGTGKTGGFFASIGRKASMRRDRPALTNMQGTGSGKNISNLVARANSNTLQIASSTAIGGPRPMGSSASRVKRSDSVIIIGRPSTEASISPKTDQFSINNESIITDSTDGTDSDVAQLSNFTLAPSTTDTTSTPSTGASLPRSSLSYRTTASRTDPSSVFNANLQKLADVLPYADRAVLAHYLQRAGGEDIRAIGAYLEDEKNGCVKYPV